MLLRNLLPEHHLDPDSRNVVNLGMALIGTMTLLCSACLSRRRKFPTTLRKSEVTQMAANIVQLDRILGRYGAGANGVRAVLRRAVLSVDQSWSEDAARSERLDSAQVRAEVASFYEKIQELTLRNDFEHSLQSQALQTALQIGQTRSPLVEQAGSSIAMSFSVVMVFWLAVIFASFGLFAPRNATVIATLFVCPWTFDRCAFNQAACRSHGSRCLSGLGHPCIWRAL
jgi:hypothetical protein